jgi:CxxC motif-containing protein
MNKEFACIECPVGCRLRVCVEGGAVVRVEGNQCPRGARYARAEIEDPRRLFTATVRASGLSLRMVPVRTSAPIPKARVLEAAASVRSINLTHAVRCGEVLVPDFLGCGVDLVASRDCA